MVGGERFRQDTMVQQLTPEPRQTPSPRIGRVISAHFRITRFSV
jgi:hypothetical protein